MGNIQDEIKDKEKEDTKKQVMALIASVVMCVLIYNIFLVHVFNLFKIALISRLLVMVFIFFVMFGFGCLVTGCSSVTKK